MKFSKDLKIEIHTSNQINILVKKEIAFLLPQLVKYLGKKIFTLKGQAKSFVIAFDDSMPTPFEGGYVSKQGVYLDSSYNKLQLVYRLCFSGGSYEDRTAYTKYVDRKIEIGEMENVDKLVKLYDLNQIVKSYELDKIINIDEEIKNIEAYAKLKEQANDAKRKINIPEEFYRYV